MNESSLFAAAVPNMNRNTVHPHSAIWSGAKAGEMDLTAKAAVASALGCSIGFSIRY